MWFNYLGLLLLIMNSIIFTTSFLYAYKNPFKRFHSGIKRGTYTAPMRMTSMDNSKRKLQSKTPSPCHPNYYFPLSVIANLEPLSDLFDRMQDYFDLTFKDNIPLDIFHNPNTLRDSAGDYYIPGCIMDDARKTMSIPLIDFDPGYYAKKILESSRVIPDDRKKPFYATVKGMGGGKTRGLEEIRRKLLLEDGVLPLAITFNYKWTVDNADDNWSDIVGSSVAGSYSMSIISRMASMFYGFDFSVAVEMIRSSFEPKYNYHSGLFARAALQGFIRHMMKKLGTYRHVDTFILLIDEVARMDEELGPRASRNMWGPLLDSEVKIKGEDSAINIGLVVSSLNIAPLGKTKSGRFIHTIPLSSDLDVFRIAEDVWVPKNRSSEDRFKLRLIASMVNTIPRLVEYAKTAVNKTESIRKMEVSDANLTRSDLRSIVEQILESARWAYSAHLTSYELLASIIFGDQVSLKSNEVLDAISASLITNSIDHIGLTDSIIVSARTSFIVLMLAASTPDDHTLDIMNNSFMEMLDAIIKFPLNEVGAILEVVAFEWLVIRAYVSTISNEGSISLAKLLGIKKTRINCVISVKHRKILRTQICLETYRKITLSALATKDMLDAIKVDNTEIVLIKPFSGEAWDMCMKVWPQNQKTPFYIFLEFKSIDETYINNMKITKTAPPDICLENFPKKGKQYISTNRMMNNSDNFVYLYMNTFDAESFYLGRVICLNRCETFDFLGPMKPLYMVARRANPGPMQN
eukprot:gene12561-26452_t